MVVACVFPEFVVLFVSFESVLKKWVIGFVLFSYQFGPLFIVIVVVFVLLPLLVLLLFLPLCLAKWLL